MPHHSTSTLTVPGPGRRLGDLVDPDVAAAVEPGCPHVIAHDVWCTSASAVDRGLEALEARLQLQREELRVVPRLVEVAAVHPQVRHLRRLPHVALLALPRTGVLGGVGAEAPALAEPVGGLGVDEVGDPAVHRVVAGGEHDHVGRQLGAVVEHDGVLGQVRHLAVHELHVAVGHQLGGAHVDVVARAAAQVLHEQPRLVGAEVQPEAGLLEPVVEVLVPLLHLVVERDLEGVQDPVGQRREDHVGLLGRDACRHRLLGVERTEPDLHEAVALDDVRRGALHHGHVGVVLPQRPADVEGGVVAADHDRLLAGVRVRSGVPRGVVDVAL